jgi:ferrochelatase
LTAAVDAVLLIAFGGPERPEDIRPFLELVARGRPIPPERLDEVARHYERMPGGRSPLGDLTRRQARALARALEVPGPALPVFVGMRHWHPFLHETLAAMRDKGARRALALILSAFRTEASWDRYLDDARTARARVLGAPEVVFGPPWCDHPRFIAAAADRAGAALAAVPAGERAATPLVFTAHSVPTAMAAASPYVAEFTAASASVADRLGHDRWVCAYQSRSGGPGEPWLEPDVGAVLRDLARQGARRVVVSPLGFVCDHVEVLYDLDVEARAIAEASGLAFHRAAAVNDHPEFVLLLAEQVRDAVARAA